MPSFDKRNQLVPSGVARNLTPAIASHQFLHIESTFSHEFLTIPVDVRNNAFWIHGSSDFKSSAGVQITGQL